MASFAITNSQQSLLASLNLNKTSSDTSLQRPSSGMKINREADAPASLGMEKMSRTQITGSTRTANAAVPNAGTSESTVVNISMNGRELVQSILNGAPVAAGDAATGASTASAVKSEFEPGSAAVSSGFESAIRNSLQEATSEGLDALVDADLEKESAKLQALQVKQQLTIQTLNIANQKPQTLQSLFR